MNLSVPLIMLTSAAGLVLLKAPRNARLLSLSLLWSSAAMSFALTPSRAELPTDQMLWGLVIITAAVAYFPEAVAMKLAPTVCSAAGLVCGAAIKAAGIPPHLLILAGAATALLASTRRWPLVDWGVKVVCSWLIAVAVLAVALPLITTPGYERDHMN
ncbi:MAG TPA: hypothetical protein VGR19_09255 [Allosphingosinicella sp.]|nr:hypothetical protein [Allosphingosinicella sp.]